MDPKAKSKGDADSYDETKTILTNFNKKKKQPVKRKTSILYLHVY